MSYPSEKEFLQLTAKGNLIPIYKEIAGDLDTPVSAYYKLSKKAKYSFLLESVEGEEKIARYSFLACNPDLILQSKNKKLQVTDFTAKKANVTTQTIDQNPLKYIRNIIDQYTFVQLPELPRFCGGLVGYFSYDVVRFFERLPDTTKDDLKLPDIYLMLAKSLVIFDHLNHKIKIVRCINIPQNASNSEKKQLYKKAVEHIDKLIYQLQQPLILPKSRQTKKSTQKLTVKSNFSQLEFENAVKKAKKQIQAGEIIQVVLSQRFRVSLKTDPFQIYRALRSLNPSPYMYYLHFDQLQIIGSSPELLVRCENGIVDTRPIAGTRPRGKDDAQDSQFANDLINDPKEKAEHIMLVDLGRNDLGRVCKKGTVHLSEFMKIEKYSHVMHIVSNVRGALDPKQDDLDVLQAAFPAGTVSGAPKIRAMEIIEDLESVRRGPYAGCIGYFSFSGNLDSCITIRTIVAVKGNAYVQAGAGIVADSHPETEYHETMNKAKAQIMAIQLAHNKFS